MLKVVRQYVKTKVSAFHRYNQPLKRPVPIVCGIHCYIHIIMRADTRFCTQIWGQTKRNEYLNWITYMLWSSHRKLGARVLGFNLFANFPSPPPFPSPSLFSKVLVNYSFSICSNLHTFFNFIFILGKAAQLENALVGFFVLTLLPTYCSL